MGGALVGRLLTGLRLVISLRSLSGKGPAMKLLNIIKDIMKALLEESWVILTLSIDIDK